MYESGARVLRFGSLNNNTGQTVDPNEIDFTRSHVSDRSKLYTTCHTPGRAEYSEYESGPVAHARVSTFRIATQGRVEDGTIRCEEY